MAETNEKSIQGAIDTLNWLAGREGSIDDRRGADRTARRLQRELDNWGKEPEMPAGVQPESVDSKGEKKAAPAAKKAAAPATKTPAKK